MNLRKPRVLIFDDDARIREFLSQYFSLKGYESLSFAEPLACPLYENQTGDCSDLRPCADLLITDYRMARMSGVEMLEIHRRRGCRLDAKNKAVMSGYIDDEGFRGVEALGCAFFRKPFSIADLEGWVRDCEGRMDLSQPVGIKRKEVRRHVSEEVVFRCDVDAEKRTGLLTNFSDSGLCLTVSDPVPRDQTIMINTRLSNSCQSAEVRWVRRADAGFYEVGLFCA